MRSLRLRLILGIALVAIVPLALAMFVMSRTIERTVRTQAAERLDSALGALQLQLADDGAHIADQLRILARDPVLRRLTLLRPAGDRDLADYFSERRSLLGLDFLSATDTTGTLIADASNLTSPVRDDEDAWLAVAARHRASDSVVVERLGDAPSLVMDASAAIRYEGMIAGAVVGGRALDSALLARLERTSGVALALADTAAHLIVPSHSINSFAADAPGTGVQRVEVSGRSYLARSMALAIGPPPHAVITGYVPTAPADQTIDALQLTSLLLGVLGLGIAILLGTLWSLQISRPVERLAAYSQQLARGEWDEPLKLRSVKELEALVAALDRMRTDLRGYRERLVVSERHTAWSQMARRVAHEVKNPLTPIAISVADLKRSFDQQRPDFPQILDQAVRTVAEEIETLRRLLQEFSEFGRFPAPRFEHCRVSELLGSLATLYARDVEEGRVTFAVAQSDTTIEADAEQLRQVLINLIKNGLEATPGGGRVRVTASDDEAFLRISVADDGPGLSEQQRESLFVPGFTTKTQGSGLGLAIAERIVNDHHGTIDVESALGRGTTLHIRLPHEHPPDGDRATARTSEAR